MRKGARGCLVLTPMAAVLLAAFMSFAGETRTVTSVADLVQALDELKDDASNTVILAPSSEPYDVSGCAMLCNDADKAKYLWSTSHIAISKLTLRGGGQTARDTVIYGNGTQRILYAWQGKIQNLTISNGCTRAGEPGLGGGILARNESTVCSNVVVTCCSAKAAGGIANAGSIGCEVSDCTAETYGGGVYTTSYFRDGKLLHNRAGTYGGGAANCVVSNSCLMYNRAGTYGGGGFDTTAFDNVVVWNQADRSGGGFAYNLKDTVSGCVIVSNRVDCPDGSSNGEAYGSGGGIWVTGSPAVTISDCLIADNEAIHRGGGVKGGSSGTILQRCIISNNVVRGRATYTVRAYGGGCDQCRIYDSQVLCNLVTSDYCSTAAGGGMSYGSASNCVIRGNAVAMCKATNKMGGGGQGNAFTNCVIVDNFANVGGAMNAGRASFCFISNNVTATGSHTLRVTEALEDCEIYNAVIDSPGVMRRTSMRGYGNGWTLDKGANIYTNGTFTVDESANIYLLANTQVTATYATNCLFVGNKCKGLVSRPANAYPVTPFVNCTIADNRFDWTTIGFSPDSVTLAEFVNCIITCNSNRAATAALDFALNNNTVTNVSFVNCMIGSHRSSSWKPLHESGTITNDVPKFDRSNVAHPYSLKLSSPAVAKGLVQPWMADAYDIRGAIDDGGKYRYLRLRDGKVDIGCYQCWLDPVGTTLMFR